MSLTQNLNVIPFSLTGLNNINASSINGQTIYTGNVLITFTSALIPSFIYNSSTNTIILNLPYSSSLNNGILSNNDWSLFNSKENLLNFNNPLNRVGNTISIQQASSSLSGYLSSTDWSLFNSKENILSFSSPLNRTSNTISIQQASSSLNGYLSSTDWTTFNNKVSSVSAGTNMNVSGTAKDPIINLNSSLNNITLNGASVINGNSTNSLTIALPSWSFTGSTPCYLLCQVGANTCYYLSTSQLYSLYPPPTTPTSYNGIDVNNANYNFNTNALTALLNNGFIYSSSNITTNLNLTFPSANMLASVFGSVYTIRFQIIQSTGAFSYILNYNSGGTTYININSSNVVPPFNIGANVSWDCVIQLKLVSGTQVSYIDFKSQGVDTPNLVLTSLTNLLTINGSSTSVDIGSCNAITQLIQKTEKILHLYGQIETTINSDLKVLDGSNTSLYIGSSICDIKPTINTPININSIGSLTSSQTEKVQFQIGNTSSALNAYSLFTLPSLNNLTTNPNFASAILSGVANSSVSWSPALEIRASNNVSTGTLYKGSEINYGYLGSGNSFSINNGATTGNSFYITNQNYANYSQIAVLTANLTLSSTDGSSTSSINIIPSNIILNGSIITGTASNELKKTIASTSSGGSGVQNISTTQTLVAGGKNRCYIFNPSVNCRINLPQVSLLNIGDWYSITNISTSFALNIYNFSGTQIGLCNAGTYGNSNKYAMMYNGASQNWYQIT